MKLKHEPRSFLYQFPEPFIILASLNFKKRHILVDRHTEIVIEGFPRSANTFAHVAFEFAQQRPVAIASHFHAPGQVIWALRHNIPTLLLIRNPIDSVSSLIIREHYLSIKQGLRSYINFYNRLRPYQNKLVMAEFNQITCDFGKVIMRVNQFYGTSFKIFQHTEQNVETCFKILEELDKKDTGRDSVTETTVTRPSKIRRKAKEDVKKEIQTEKYRSLVNQAERIYHTYLNDDPST